ncbi:MAG: hypothetical protein RI513_03920 [Balneolaceae bacterium]|nr:hypothetical protein [Balneolaceae bacterium]MDR9446690.1 hypothetical protein [Balneolaceae bacterium]
MNQPSLGRMILIGTIMLLSYVMLFQHVTIARISLDLMAIYLMWIMLAYPRFQSMWFAAVVGFLLDAMTDQWGLNMFAYTGAVTLLYGVFERFREIKLLDWQYLTLLFGFILIKSSLFAVTTLFTNGVDLAQPVWLFILGTSVYTVIVGYIVNVISPS